MKGIALDEELQPFIEKLKARPDVLGIILFGSRARGDSRPDSDVDLVVILRDGYRRAVERWGGFVFEIIYVTEPAALEFWETHRDDCAGTWEATKALHDKDGAVARLEKRVTEMLREGKRPIDEHGRGQLLFDSEDQIAYAERMLENDPATAGLILGNKIFALSGTFFDLRADWTPGPKRRLKRIAELDPRAYRAFKEFYQQSGGLPDKVRAARAVVEVVFGPKK